MGPKLGDLGKQRLNTLLQSHHLALSDEEMKTVNKNWLVRRAAQAGVITPQQEVASLEKDIIVRKRYLASLVKNPAVLDAINAYVKLASQVRAAGSVLANLFAIEAFEAGNFHGADADAFIENTLLDQTFVKYLMLPFKAVISGQSADVMHSLPELLRATWATHHHRLEPLYPSHEALKSTFPWDQPLTDMAREYIGATTAHVMTHLGERLKRHVGKVMSDTLHVRMRRDPTTGRMQGSVPDTPPFFISDVYDALDSAAEPQLPFPPVVAALVQGIRTRLGLSGHARISNSRPQRSASTSTFHAKTARLLSVPALSSRRTGPLPTWTTGCWKSYGHWYALLPPLPSTPSPPSST